MLGTKPRPMIGKLSELLVSGTRAAVADFGTSPRGLKNYDLGGVGLGIVAALEKSGEAGKETLAKFTLCCCSLNRTSPRPVNCDSGKHGSRFRGDVVDDSEDYTYVTCHIPNKRITKVYYDRGYRDGFESFGELGLSRNSRRRSSTNFSEYPTSDFLSSCHLCRKKLHGKDIYMYRGEKGFCSPECRSSYMVMEERKEQCRSEAVDVSSSPYTRGQIFSRGILAV